MTELSLLTAIFDPNAAVESRYVAYTAETKSGREFTGIITAETPNNIVMKSADGTEETILRTDLKSLLGSGISLMPEGMESALKPQDMADVAMKTKDLGFKLEQVQDFTPTPMTVLLFSRNFETSGEKSESPLIMTKVSTCAFV